MAVSPTKTVDRPISYYSVVIKSKEYPIFAKIKLTDMDGIQIHLLLNHFPIIGTFIGTVLLAWGMLRAQYAVKQTGLILLVAMGLIGIPVHISGEDAEHKVERLEGVDHHLVHEHEEWGGRAFLAGNITLLVALIAFVAGFFSHNTKVLSSVALIAAIITCAVMVQTGSTGGKIRHPEIRGEVSH